MWNGMPQPVLLFDELNVKTDDDLLQLKKSSLLKILQQLKTTESMNGLRKEIADLKNQLSNGRNPLRANTTDDIDDVVEISQNYVMSELDQIAASFTLERASYYVERFIKGVSEVRQSAINDINLNRWKEYEDLYTDSLWVEERRDNSGVHTAGYWGNFIPQIPYQMMQRYTKKGDWVLDTFAGSGTTLIEGQRLGRHSIGIELQTEVAQQAQSLIAAEPNRHKVTTKIITDDSAAANYQSILEQHGRRSVQLVMMHPPYFDIIKFSNDPRDLSNAPSVDDFLQMLGKIVEHVRPVLDKGRYLALVISDKYAKGHWIPLGFLTMNEVLRHGFSLKSIVVKNFDETAGKRNHKELWRYRALVGGFYIFKHEYIFVFKKT